MQPIDASAAYLEAIRQELPEYDRLQDEVVRATDGLNVVRLLDLGVGTGETSRRLLLAHPAAISTAVDGDPDLLEIARAQLGARANLSLRDLYEPLPSGPFDLVVSALSAHNLRHDDRTRLVARAYRVLRPGGRLVLADAITPGIVQAGQPPLDIRGPDHLETIVDRMRAVGLTTRTTWSSAQLAVVVGQR